MTETIDRSHDISQALDRLSADERMKDASDYLRGTIAEGLLDRITGAVPSADDVKLMKFHGIYQQDDRDLRDERRRQKLEPAYQFMIRVRLPGGVCTPAQWLKLDELARAHGGETLRITTRQTFQFHWVLKDSLRPIIQGLHETLLDTIAACGDDSRGVMSTVDPQASRFHAEVAALAKRVSDHVIPKTRAYHEIWYGDERVASSAPEELFYGRTYMPRKFKIGFALPPSNDIDVYAQDLGFIAIGGEGGLEGFNVVIGGGMGRTDQAPETYPRLASLIGSPPPGSSRPRSPHAPRPPSFRPPQGPAARPVQVHDRRQGAGLGQGRARARDGRILRRSATVLVRLERRYVWLAGNPRRPVPPHDIRRERPARYAAARCLS